VDRYKAQELHDEKCISLGDVYKVATAWGELFGNADLGVLEIYLVQEYSTCLEELHMEDEQQPASY
jgi:hypothetical protein